MESPFMAMFVYARFPNVKNRLLLKAQKGIAQRYVLQNMAGRSSLQMVLEIDARFIFDRALTARS
jgi:hypothetical protein